MQYRQRNTAITTARTTSNATPTLRDDSENKHKGSGVRGDVGRERDAQIMCTDGQTEDYKQKRRKSSTGAEAASASAAAATATTTPRTSSASPPAPTTTTTSSSSIPTTTTSSSSIPTTSTTRTTTSSTEWKPRTKTKKSSWTGHKSGLKWKIIISSIILLICRLGHVLAIRKGRLMSPSSFTALSGDLHVQIQFSADEVGFEASSMGGGPEATTSRGATSSTATTTGTTGTTTTTTSSSTTSTSRTTGETTQSSSFSTTTTRTTSAERTRPMSHENASTTTTRTTTSIPVSSNVESTITTTLVISKFVDELLPSSSSSSLAPLSPSLLGEAGRSWSSNSNNTGLPPPPTAEGGGAGGAEEAKLGQGTGTGTDLGRDSFLEESSRESPSSSASPSAPSLSPSGNTGQVLLRRRKEIIQNIPLYPDPRNNVTQIAVPCQTFIEGGLYEMQVVTNLKTTTTTTMAEVENSSSSRSNEVSNKDNRSGEKAAGKGRNNIDKGATKGKRPERGGTRYRNGSPTTTTTTTTTTLMPATDERLRQTLDVRWPTAEILVEPTRLLTYPEHPVAVTLRFPEVNCDRAWLHHALPEFWLELIYCGKERRCGGQAEDGHAEADDDPLRASRNASILYAEQIRGFPKEKLLQLGCELFGLAGNYAVQLRPMTSGGGRRQQAMPTLRRFLSVDWSDKFVFNVYARSIFPCDPHTGIGVLYEYPGCILEQGDRVRVYAKLRADVASLKPPTTLHYVAEQRVVKSQYSLYFSCDLFSEKYVEYCFVYVSQAISGAVADVRMDCVPTLPVRESDTGGWGPWSEWTPCSTNCLGGTRNRYRFCDSPPPRYGAKFCEGPRVETEKCGKSVADTWDCIYETSGSLAAGVNRTEVSQEIGPGCRCGCIVHMGSSKPKRIIAGATQSCPGRSFWLLQVDDGETIRLALNFLRLPCPAQYIRVRDGASLSSNLLVELKGGSNLNNLPEPLESAGAQLLVEFYAGDGADGDQAVADQEEAEGRPRATASSSSAAAAATAASCTGGFLANVEQIGRRNSSSSTGSTVLAATRLSVRSRAVLHQKPRLRAGFTLVHLSAVVFASIIILISALLGAQYVVRYRKYHLAIARRRDQGSRLHTPRASLGSLHQPPSRAVSTTTLISEVIYMVKMRPKHQLRHSILRESIDAEALARETEFGGDGGGSIGDDGDVARLTQCVEELGSANSIVTLRNCDSRSASLDDGGSLSGEADGGGRSATTATMRRTSTLTPTTAPTTATPGSRSGTLTRKDSGRDTDSIVSSGMSSICQSPPMDGRRLSRYSDRYDAATLKIRNSLRMFESPGPDAAPGDRSASGGLRDYERLSQMDGGEARGPRSASASLTNGCYSPAASVISTATIRTTSGGSTSASNPKESKEKQNRKKLLARPGSEFSLGNPEDLELDYYDYNVINAGAAPGSYLGMDPAHLIWIPPFDDDDDDAGGVAADLDAADKTPEPGYDCGEPLYEEIKMPRYGHYLSPGSNTETASSSFSTGEDELSPLSSQGQSKANSPSETNLKNCLIQRVLSGSNNNKAPNNKAPNNKAPNNNLTPNGSKPSTPFMNRRQRKAAKKQSMSSPALGHGPESIALHELCGTKSARSIATGRTATTPTPAATPSPSPEGGRDEMSDSYVEKETSVVKSPSDLQNFLALDDIQFADESESDHDAVTAGVGRERERQKLKQSQNQPQSQAHQATGKQKTARSVLRGPYEVEV